MGHSHAGHKHDHDHKHGPDCDHGHEHSETYIEACNHEADAERHMALYLIGGVCVLTTPVASWLGFSDSVAQIPAWIGSLVLAYPLLKSAWEEIRKGKPGSSTLVAVAISAAIASRQFFAAGILAFVLLLIGVLIRRTAFGAQRAIAELVALTPDVARVLIDGVEQEVKLSDVKVGMTVRVRAGENLPVDGKVGMNFVGNIEPEDVIRGEADVIIADGFVGNIIIKSFEAMGSALSNLIRSEIRKDAVSTVGGLLARNAFRRVAKQVDPFELGGAPLLGVNGVVIIGHGRSNAKAIKNAIRQARIAVSVDFIESIREGITSLSTQDGKELG